MLVVACADPGTTASTEPSTTGAGVSTARQQLDELATARSTWEATAPADYTVRTSEQLLAVREGEVVSLASQGGQTIDEVF